MLADSNYYELHASSPERLLIIELPAKQRLVVAH